MSRRSVIQVFEHQTLKIGQSSQGVLFTQAHFLALEKLHGEKGVPFYTLIYHGVRFCQYVGALQVGDLLIQVLPKADRSSDTAHWNRVLIGMLRAVHGFDVLAPSSAGLKLRAHSVLDLYFELFVTEVEQLLHWGLMRSYRREDGNCSALRGRIVFAQHLQRNVVHQERFFTRHSVYDRDGVYNQVLLKTLHLLRRINTGAELQGRISALLLQFPELSDVHVDEVLFNRLTFNRRSESYKKAIDIARLLLLNFHPDVNLGRSDVLALMFDMNLLWERFVYLSLRRQAATCPGLHTLSAQSGKDFWQPLKGAKSRIRPDILLTMDDGRVVVLDTKWKNLNGSAPSAEDLRQLYAYSRFYDSANAALVYPSESMSASIGTFLDGDNARCGVIMIGIEEGIIGWQKTLAKHIFSSALFVQPLLN